ncbi:MAG: hypothetical protein NC917_07165 [Candidatus Omnitrophica bacterium]|nr:hypothetical protein [Candidatus Omnitrophota bacterium]
MKRQKSISLIKVMDEKEIEEEFLPQLQNALKNLYKILNRFNIKSTLPQRELSFALLKEADEVETFLDEFGANHNKRFFALREMVAAIRWFNFFLFQGLHLYSRIKHYKLSITPKEYTEFKKGLKKNLTYFYKIIKKISNKFFEECELIGLKRYKGKFQLEKLFPQLQRKILPPNIDEGVAIGEEERIIEILIKYLNVCEEFNLYVCYKQGDFSKEESIEKYRSLFGQLESLYDTYIKNTIYEIEIVDFKKVRGHIAVSLHLLEMAKALAHFFERHIEKAIYLDGYTKIINCIGDEKKIKETIEKFLFPYVLNFSEKGKEICEKIFNKLGKNPEEFLIETKVMTIPSHRLEDFHIRPIMPVTQIANKYNLDSYLYFNRKKYKLKDSIEMAIAIPDIREALAKENVRIVIQGPLSAINEIVEFFKEKCGAIEQSLKCETSLDR